MKTLSAYLTSPWKFELREVELPDVPPDNWLLIRVTACGVCGTDLTAAEHAQKWKPFGHEVAGVIERAGGNSAGLKEGQSIVLESSSFCGHCELCRNGRVDLCNKAAGFWGQPAMGFSQHMLVPACCAVPYDGLTPEFACLTEPAGVAYDMVRVADIRLGDRVCVIGPGPIGLMALAFAKFSGASRLACIGHTHSQRRLELVRKIGAEVIAHDGSIAELKQLARQFDHVLLTAPVATIPPALTLLAYEGKLTYIGIGHGDSRISFDANEFHFRKLQIRSSFASPATYFPRVLALLKAGQIPLAELVSHTLPLARIADAMVLLRDKPGECIKVVVKPE
jgi:L-iditol 2-dehydrogenase